MDERPRSAIFAVAALAALYAALSGLGIAGVESGAGGVVYRLLIIAALAYSCSRAFKGANMGGAPLAGALGLGAFAVFELYSFAYVYLHGGQAADITVSSYTRNCAYLFFMVAAAQLLRPVFGASKAIRALLGVISSFAVAVVCYATIDGSYGLLAYSALAVTLICLLSAAALFHSTKAGDAARLFAVAIMVVCLLDTANRVVVLGDVGRHIRDTILSVYPAAYLLIGHALTGLRKEVANVE